MLLFIGKLIPNDMLEWYKTHSKVSVPTSSETHQKAILKGLASRKKVFYINTIPSGFYPTRFDKASVDRKEDGNNGVTVHSSNIPILRILVNVPILVDECVKAIKKNHIECVFVYMPFVEYSLVIDQIKKNYPDLPVIAIIPDLVKHSYRKDGHPLNVIIKKAIRYLQGKIVKYYTRKVDGFIYLTSQMQKEFGPNRKYMVMEAIYEPLELNIPKENSTRKIMTYCGKISKENGVERLVRTFMRIKNDEWELQICGDGDNLKKIVDIAKGDNRIIFTGQLSHEEVLVKEYTSDVLINPRYTYIENAAYSFPSKLIEYMACGKTVISSKLSGIPNEYDDCLIYIEDDSELALENAIVKVMNMCEKELNDIGKRNAKFVNDYKSTYAQGKRMLDFAKKLIK